MAHQMLDRSTAGMPDLDFIPEQEDAESLVVWAFRRWVMGVRHQAPDQWEMVLRGLRRRCGDPVAREAAVALAEMIEALRRTARRTVTHHQPCCRCVGDDEALLLVLLGACQQGDGPLARTAAQTLSGVAHPDGLLEGAMRFAEAFAVRGLMLPRRDMPTGSAFPDGIMIH
ncbi:hypothetical protein JL100_019725 [Skermanella mucosa]|uniref:hypothetical protein n=1 Tax=Skermanella mucosa TaxID=1789672 RepID=UPI00192CB8B1|nr:hypothetical protein [Skermanella mucosa]UEM19310.1 hypothetical protein JL100_019725 [Skermanella mucosa]